MQVYRWPDDATYEGEVQDGQRHGVGTLTFAHSPASYRGEWARGKRHGRGVLTYDREQRCFYDGAAGRGRLQLATPASQPARRS